MKKQFLAAALLAGGALFGQGQAPQYGAPPPNGQYGQYGAPPQNGQYEDPNGYQDPNGQYGDPGYAAPAPPQAPVYAAAPPPAPGPGYIWIDPYWNFIGGRYVYVNGYWGLPPYAGDYWFGPRYYGGHYYAGYWGRSGVRGGVVVRGNYGYRGGGFGHAYVSPGRQVTGGHAFVQGHAAVQGHAVTRAGGHFGASYSRGGRR